VLAFVSLSALGCIVAAGMAGYLASCLASAGAVRRLGIGRLLALSGALVALSLAAIASTERWPLLPAAGFVAGLGAGAIDAGINAYAARSFSPRMVSWLHAASAGLLEILRRPAVRWSALLFFRYTGLEVTVAQWSFALLTEGRGIATGPAGAMVSGYWASLTAGRIGCGLFAARLGARRILGASIAAIPILALWFAVSGGGVASALGLAGLGLAYAGVFPLLVSETPGRVGARYADQA
jgi:fucose permease